MKTVFIKQHNKSTSDNNRDSHPPSTCNGNTKNKIENTNNNRNSCSNMNNSSSQGENKIIRLGTIMLLVLVYNTTVYY